MISTFYKKIEQYRKFDYKSFFNNLNSCTIENAIYSRNMSELEFLTLLSPLAENYLETLAQKAQQTTIKHFGKTIQLYTPMYISNYCNNECLYCGFNRENNIKRKQLTFDEIEKESKEIVKSNIKHILVLTGSARNIATPKYILGAVKVIKRYFSSISIEIYPMDQKGYKSLFAAGVDGLTIYQETYDEELYAKLHPSGPKKNYHYRLSAPDRGCRAGIRRINLGVLLGLKDWREDVFLATLHCAYLQNKYPSTEISISLPRIRSHTGSYTPHASVADKNMVQILTAFRLFIPRSGINISTREEPLFRDNIIPLGTTNMSAGCTTAVGGHTKDDSTKQFEIADTRSVKEIEKLIYNKGYQPIFKDWQYLN
jgi:2-iminoacetate synthase